MLFSVCFLINTCLISVFVKSSSCSGVFDNFVKINIVCHCSDQWVNEDTIFLLFSCVLGRLWLSLFRWRWGQTGLWPTLSDPIMSNTLIVSVCPPNIPMTSSACRVRKMIQWCGALWDNAEIYAWTQTGAGVLSLFFSLSPLCATFSLFFLSNSLILILSSKHLTSCFWWLSSFTDCLLGLGRGVLVFEGETEALVRVWENSAVFLVSVAFWLG